MLRLLHPQAQQCIGERDADRRGLATSLLALVQISGLNPLKAVE